MKHQRQIIILILACLLVQSVPVSAVSSNRFEYTVSNGGAIITGCDGNPQGQLVIPEVLDGYKVTGIGDRAFFLDDLTGISIPNTVTFIGERAFYHCDKLTDIVIPDSVTEIGAEAFDNCRSMTSIELPDKLAVLSEGLFRECQALTSATLPHGLMRIEDEVFSGCKSLESIVLPQGLQFLGNDIFNGCSKLPGLALPASLTEAGPHAFRGYRTKTGINADTASPIFCNDEYGVLFNKQQTLLIQAPQTLSGSYRVPSTVTQIAERAFYACKITDVELPGGLNRLEAETFMYCQGLTHIRLPEGMTSIGDSAFAWCSDLEAIELPSTLTQLGEGAFVWCSDLTSITLPEGVTEVKDSTFFFCICLKQVTLGLRVTRIGKWAFEGCEDLTDMVIPRSVTEIGSAAFEDCKRLDTVYFCGDAPVMDNTVFNSDVQAEAHYHPGTQGWTAEVLSSHGAGSLTWVQTHICPDYTPDGNHTCTQDGTKSGLCLSCGITDVTADPGSARHEFVTAAHSPTQCSICSRLLGDVTLDGKLNVSDVSRLYAHTKGTRPMTGHLLQVGNVTNDRWLNVNDVARLYAHVKGSVSLW